MCLIVYLLFLNFYGSGNDNKKIYKEKNPVDK